MAPEDLKRVVAGWKVKSRRVVFTNGVFDILHRGHVSLLAEAAGFGHRLIVGLNSDASVKTLGKGDNRPVNPTDDRALVLASLQMVDAVVVFDQSTPIELVKMFEPDVLVKGGDYDPEESDPNNPAYIVGSDFQKAAGKKVVAIPLVKGYSTTSLIEKLRDGQG